MPCCRGYFGEGKWDGPLSLHEMLAIQDPNLLSFVSDYKMNLITPEGTSDEVIDRLTSSLREVMFVIKYSKDKEKLTKLLHTDPRFKNMERKAARVVKTVTGIQVDVENEEETIDMCQALKEMMEDATNVGIQQGLQQGLQQGIQDERIATAKRLLKKDSFSYIGIAELSALSIDEVKAIAEETL